MIPVTVGQHTFPMHQMHKDVLDHAKKLAKQDWDMIFLYDGYEGSGKSVKAMQDAYYFDPSLTLDRVTFSSNEFRKAVTTAEQYQAVIYDEAFTGLSSRGAMSTINKALVQMLAEIRQKRLFVAIVMPTFFDLDRYAALWRSRALITVYVDDEYRRGKFAYFNGERKKQLYIEGKKFYDYKCVKPSFYGNFTNYYVVDEQAYREKKRLRLSKREADAMELATRRSMQQENFIRLLTDEKTKDWTHSMRSIALNMPEATFYYWLQKWNETGKLE